jgi:threonine aldolase
METLENKKEFYSDNGPGVHPQIMEAIQAANVGHARPYGGDPYTASATLRFKEHFGDEAEIFFAFNGTAANVLSIASLTRAHHSVVCAKTSHIYIGECGAAERFTGCSMVPVPSVEGKIEVDGLAQLIPPPEDSHVSQARVLSITQPTELGTVYSLDEIRALADFAHERHMFLHLDGARLPNAAASLGIGFKQMTTDVGVDVVSFGGTKNGLLLGDAVVFCRQGLTDGMAHIHKQGLQQASKMRFLAVQFEALLHDDLWRQIAQHENAMARFLGQQIEAIPQVRLSHPIEANAVFAFMPPERIATLQEHYFFPVWEAATGEVRWMAGFDTTEEDVLDFVACIKRVVA